MTHRAETIERDDWLRHAAALRRLAASLLADEHEAEDLVQETWLRARKTDAAKSAPWYRTVLRNLARDRMRERGRRSASERDAARAERLPSEGEVAERLEIVRRVAVEVAQLAEPYRTAVHLRYFEDLSPAEIARVAGVPVETVRTRLRRGLETLRERMDRAHGGQRDAWALALVPLATRAGSGAGFLTSAGTIMSTKVAISGAAAVVVAVGLLLGWRASRPTVRPSDPLGQVGMQLDAGRREEPRANLNSATQTARESIPTPPAAPVPAVDEPAMVEVCGTVVIEDENGMEHSTESGKLTIARLPSGTRTLAPVQEIEVHQGTWSVRIPAGELLTVGKLVARDREVVLSRFEPRFPGPDPIAVRGKWFARGRLRVVDAETKEDLKEIEVRCADGWRANPRWTHPGDDPRVRAVISQGVSPIELPEQKRLTPYWVHAPGHAWNRVDFDHQTAGQRTIELSPAPSSVVVTTSGGANPANAFIRLYPTAKTYSESGFTFSMPDRPEDWLAAVSIHASKRGETRIDDLEGGSYVAAIEVGRMEETLRIGETSLEVPQGRSTSVNIVIDPTLLEVPRTHLWGTIRMPKDIERRFCSLALERIGGGERTYSLGLDRMGSSSGDESQLQWDAGSVRTGDYIAHVGFIEYREIIHAPGPGETKVAIEIPPLTEISVNVVDISTGAAVEPERLQWQPPPVEGISKSVLAPVLRLGSDGGFRFVAPRGNVLLRCTAAGYEDLEQSLSVDGRKMACTLSMTRATGIRILIREEGAALPVGFGYLQGIRFVRDDGEVDSQGRVRSTESECTRFLRAPGRYRVEFPPLEGFEPIDPRPVDVREGEVVDVTIEPKRKH